MALLTLHINVCSNEDVWNTVMEQSRKSRKPGQFEFRQWQQMFLEVLETASVNPALETIRNVSQAGSFTIGIQSF